VGEGRRGIARTEVLLTELVDGAVRQTAALARSRGVSIAASVDPVAVEVDRVRLGQALANLVTNAIVHGPTDSRVAISGRVERGVLLELEVVDRGPGIPAAVRDTLFVPFQRGREAASTGHGLGLAIADAAVRAHGGTLALEAILAGGTRARIRIPLDAPTPRSVERA
jgi:signal transduction histidine kinase